jgi:hypothetical protein
MQGSHESTKQHEEEHEERPVRQVEEFRIEK